MLSVAQKAQSKHMILLASRDNKLGVISRDPYTYLSLQLVTVMQGFVSTFGTFLMGYGKEWRFVNTTIHACIARMIPDTHCK